MRNLVFIFLVFYACSTTKEHVNYKYARSKFTLQRPSLLRTDGVYLEKTTGINYEGKIIKGYSFYRFYENGRCFFFEWREGIPNDSILLTTNKKFGQRTFFRNNGNNVTIEHWGGYIGYAFYYGVVYKDSIIINSYKPRGFLSVKQNFPTPQKYVFIELGLSDNANW